MGDAAGVVDGRPTGAKVEVLLATFNGERFLAQQLDSLVSQTFTDFAVLVADDCSGDATRAILERYRAVHPGRFRLLGSAGTRLGANANFARLLDAASADYVFFADQDDVWLPHKIEVSLARMRALEALHGAAAPLMVHSDLIVVDENLATLGSSFFAYSGIDPARNAFGALLLGNIATGCTLLANRALYEAGRPIPQSAQMFDHWLALAAAALGKLDCLDEPTVLYRQHGSNLVGAEKAGMATMKRRIARILRGDKTLHVLSNYSLQADVLLERYGPRLAPLHRRQARAMAGLWRRPRLLRFISLLAVGLRKPTLMTSLGLMLLVLRKALPRR